MFKHFILITLILIISVNNLVAQTQGDLSNNNSSVDSNMVHIKSAGEHLMKFNNQMSAGMGLNLLGSVLTVVGINSSINKQQTSAILIVGLLTNGVGTLMCAIAPQYVGYAGKRMNKVKAKK